MKAVKILSICTLVVVVGVLGFVIFTHIKKNKEEETPSSDGMKMSNLDNVIE